jgi:hypothetical protein
MIVGTTPSARAIVSSSWVIDGIVAAKVASSAIRRPAARARSSPASLGLSTGRRRSVFTVSIALPKAEQVNRIPSAPVARA